MRKFRKFSIFAIILCMIISCKKDPPPPKPVTTIHFSTTLTGGQEVPANTSSATVSAFVEFHTDTKLFLVLIGDYSSIPGTPLGNVHKGAVGTNGPAVIPFTSSSSPQIATYLNDTQAADLMAGQYYINVTSAAYPDGEVRGQLIKN